MKRYVIVFVGLTVGCGRSPAPVVQSRQLSPDGRNEAAIIWQKENGGAVGGSGAKLVSVAAKGTSDLTNSIVMSAYDAMTEEGVNPLSVKWLDNKTVEVHLIWGSVTKKKDKAIGADGPIHVQLTVDHPGPDPVIPESMKKKTAKTSGK